MEGMEKLTDIVSNKLADEFKEICIKLKKYNTYEINVEELIKEKDEVNKISFLLTMLSLVKIHLNIEEDCLIDENIRKFLIKI